MDGKKNAFTYFYIAGRWQKKTQYFHPENMSI